MGQVLTHAFFEQDTLTVAQELLGATLVFTGTKGLRKGRIIEVEAYIGPDDLASHAARGRTPRNLPMFGKAGFTYVYLVYGIHYCLNIVTEAVDYPAAILIRALEPIEPTDDIRAASGPGKVSRWLAITRRENQIDATGPIFYIEKRIGPTPPISISSRIGVDYAGQWRHKPWRFMLTNHPAVSGPRIGSKRSSNHGSSI